MALLSAAEPARRGELVVEVPDPVSAATLVVRLVGRFEASLQELRGVWSVKIIVRLRQRERILEELTSGLEEWLPSTTLDHVCIRDGRSRSAYRLLRLSADLGGDGVGRQASA